jgi:hypothetical protein
LRAQVDGYAARRERHARLRESLRNGLGHVRRAERDQRRLIAFGLQHDVDARSSAADRKGRASQRSAAESGFYRTRERTTRGASVARTPAFGIDRRTGCVSAMPAHGERRSRPCRVEPACRRRAMLRGNLRPVRRRWRPARCSNRSRRAHAQRGIPRLRKHATIDGLQRRSENAYFELLRHHEHDDGSGL